MVRAVIALSAAASAAAAAVTTTTTAAPVAATTTVATILPAATTTVTAAATTTVAAAATTTVAAAATTTVAAAAATTVAAAATTTAAAVVPAATTTVAAILPAATTTAAAAVPAATTTVAAAAANCNVNLLTALLNNHYHASIPCGQTVATEKANATNITEVNAGESCLFFCASGYEPNSSLPLVYTCTGGAFVNASATDCVSAPNATTLAPGTTAPVYTITLQGILALKKYGYFIAAGSPTVGNTITATQEEMLTARGLWNYAVANGWVSSGSVEVFSDTVAAEAAVGATSLEVKDQSRYTVGDVIEINGEIYTVTGFGSVTLDRPLTTAVTASTSIQVEHKKPAATEETCFSGSSLVQVNRGGRGVSAISMSELQVGDVVMAGDQLEPVIDFLHLFEPTGLTESNRLVGGSSI